MADKDSLNKRYLFKLSTNLISVVLNLFIQAIIPRGLGPKAYGDFNFLTNFFNQIIGFLDMGTSVGFFTKLSQRPREFGLVSFYSYFTACISLIIIGFVIITHLTMTYTVLWPDQEMKYIYLASGWGIITWAVQILNKMADAYGVTVSAEIAKITQKFLAAFLIVILFVLESLTLTNFFYYQYLILFILGIAFIWVLDSNGYSFKHGWGLKILQIKEYSKEFFQYSHPLFIYALIGMIVGIFDRWLLQVYGGSVQQGFFSISFQIGAICFLFTSAMTPLITREFSIAFSKNNLVQMAALFRRYIPMLYSIAAFFSCFVSFQADKVIYMFGGNSYNEAVSTVAIMAFYPIHQTYGQLSGSVFYATGQTALYRNIGVTSLLIGLPITYYLIAPMENLGLNAGATGLAVKMLLLQFIVVNIQLYYNAKFLKLSFWRYFSHQIFSVACFAVIAIISSISADKLLNENIIHSFILAGIIYSALIAGLIYMFPILLGIKRQDIYRMINIIALIARLRR